MSGHQSLIMPIWALIIRASKNGYKNMKLFKLGKS